MNHIFIGFMVAILSVNLIDRLFLDDGYHIYQDNKPIKYAENTANERNI